MTDQVTTKVKVRSIPGTIQFSLRISGTSVKYQNLEYLPPVSCGIWRQLIHCGAYEEVHRPSKLKRMVNYHSDISIYEKITLKKEWHIK